MKWKCVLNTRKPHPNGNKEKRKKKIEKNPSITQSWRWALDRKFPMYTIKVITLTAVILNFAFFFPGRSRLWLLVRLLFFLNICLRLPGGYNMHTDLELCCTESGALPWTVTPTAKWKGRGRWRGSGANLHVANGDELFEREERAVNWERERERKFGNKKFL